MLVDKDIQRFIRSDCEAAIGSSGLIGDKLLIISQGSTDAPVIKEGQQLESSEPVELDAIMANLQITTEQLAEIMVNLNSGNGTLGRLINDSSIANNFSQTILNIKSSSKGFSENMDAAKHNFLLKGYFNKKAKAEAQKKQDAEDKKAAEQKKKNADEKKAAKQKANDEKK
jgi:phospholipid/cholesterol/gamma-HCH transport system substrate-binding protein